MVGFVTAVASLGACKGEKITENPQTRMDLEQCLRDKEAKATLAKTLEEENAKLQREAGGGSEIVVVIEGNALTVRPGKPGDPPRALPDKDAGEFASKFIDVVEKSRGAIQKCYEQALKKDSGLQARTITLTVNASFSEAGAYRNASFAPALGSTFDTCIRTVASKWTLPEKPKPSTFKAQISLTPS
ncbi:MAG: hypothetical protein AB7O24_10540 [Kofleriaceae bacterium]